MHILGYIVLDSRLESLAFSRSATRACPRIKPEHDGLAAIIAEPHLIACVIFDQKIRRDITNSEHGLSSKKMNVFAKVANIGKWGVENQREIRQTQMRCNVKTCTAIKMGQKSKKFLKKCKTLSMLKPEQTTQFAE